MISLKRNAFIIIILVLLNLAINTNCYPQKLNNNKMPALDILESQDSKYLEYYKNLPEDKKTLNDLLVRNCVKAESEGEAMPEILLLIQKGADVNIQRKSLQLFETPLICVIKHGSIRQMQWLIDKGAEVNPKDPDVIPLFTALKKSDTDKIKFLLEHGAKPDAKNSFGRTALMELNYTGSRDSKDFNKQVEIAGILIEHGADVNAKAGKDDGSILAIYGSGDNPLLNASNYDNLELVRLLIKHGAEVNPRDHKANTPLHNALFFRKYDVARELISSGANVKAKNVDGETTLIKLLDGMDVRKDKYTEEDQLELAKILIEKGVDVNQIGRSFTALIYAVRSGNVPVVELLIKNGANVNTPDTYQPVTDYLGRCYSDKKNLLAQQLAMARLLVAGGAIINKTTIGSIECLYPEVLDYLAGVSSEPLTKQEITNLLNGYKKIMSERH